MLEVGDKIDDDNTSAGELTAEEFNSLMSEAENVIKPFITLDGGSVKQMSQAIDIMTKAMFYTDAGTVNAVQLSRSATTETTETLFDGMVIMFTPANANTGATTLKVKTLLAKDLKYNGLALTAGFLATNSKYIAIYSVANNRFDVDLLVNYANLQDAGIDIASTAEAQAGTDNTKAITPLRLREGLNAGGLAPMYAIRAWVLFDGVGTVAIKGSGNVSSITDLGTGYYKANFITAMNDDSYALSALGGGHKTAEGNTYPLVFSKDYQATSVSTQHQNTTGTARDIDAVAYIITGS